MFYLDVVYFIFYILFCVDINFFFFGEKISKLKKKNAISKSNEIKKKKILPTHINTLRTFTTPI